MKKYIPIIPTPPIIPVIKRLIFVDSNHPRYCIEPSINIIPKSKKERIKLGLNPIVIKIIMINCPINIPVHRAHTGNCLPLK